MPSNHYDVIIIGGRCAGVSLALWLVGNNLKILLIDRATFPSPPNIPSAPHIHPGTMRLLDELGIEESEYTHPHGKIESFAINMVGSFDVVIPTSIMELDRNYFWGIDRSLFDTTLWKRASDVPGVTAREGFSATQILKDDSDGVYGIVGNESGKESETYTADLIVGADGRFSFAARQFGATVTEAKNEYTSAVYHAEWENVADHSPDIPHAFSSYNTPDGVMTLVIPIDERKYIIGTGMKSKAATFGAQGAEQAYLDRLQQIPHLWNRLKNAQRVTPVVGIRPIENGYRQAYGKNWTLVGDAVHYKDPADGQGIYDALLESKLLAQAIIDWKQNGTSWQTAGAQYQQQLMAATHPTFEQTIANIKQTYYMVMPAIFLNTIGRWLLNDRTFQIEYLRYLSRAIPAEDYKPLRRISPKLIMNGILSDIRNRFKRGEEEYRLN